MAVIDMNQWSTVEPLIRGYPNWVGDIDALRIASYAQYEAMYWNVDHAFELVHRGTDELPIYIPTGMQIVETYHRFLANDISIYMDPTMGTDQQRKEALDLWRAFSRRERFYSKFNANKRFGIIRGDWLFHIYADRDLPEGSRISLVELDPGSYFPIYNDDNPDEVIGCYIVETVTGNDDETYIRRLKYIKESGTGGPSIILASDQIFEVDQWGGPGVEQGRPRNGVLRNHEAYVDVPLDPRITSIPVYHFQNFEEPGSIWGSSEIRGMERLLAAINQTISDEDLTLAMEGLGVYVTNAGRPVNEAGEEVPWNLGPARVVELPDGEDLMFERVNSSNNFGPFQDHLKYLHEQAYRSKGLSDAAIGRVDVNAAESGIALRLQLEPLLARSGEGELTITDRLVNMLYDLRAWFAAYEGLGGLEEVQWLPRYGEKLPLNKAERFTQIITMHEKGIIDAGTAREMLTEIGYNFPADIADRIDAEDQKKVDLFGARMDAELGESVGEEVEEE